MSEEKLDGVDETSPLAFFKIKKSDHQDGSQDDGDAEFAAASCASESEKEADAKQPSDHQGKTNEGKSNNEIFREMAFQKDENGEYVVNVVNDNETFDPGGKGDYDYDIYSSLYSGSKGRLKGYESEVFNPDLLTVHHVHETLSPLTKLDSMVGLESIKRLLFVIEARHSLDERRAAAGLLKSTPSNHFIFQGNPGTGKTEVGRVVGSFLYQAGVLSRGHVVEVDHSYLKAPYVGWSAIRVRETCKFARGGVLMIDEAHALFDDYGYNDEILHELIKCMEDYRDDLVVVLADYKEGLKPLLGTYEGLKSRIRHVIDFPDYDAEAMCRIYKKFCEDHAYVIDETAGTALLALLKKCVRYMDARTAGNARLVRNIFETSLENMAVRVISQELEGEDALKTICFPDIPGFTDVSESSAGRLSEENNVTPLFPDDEKT